jgi:branched-chain amino acid aminotransferase
MIWVRGEVIPDDGLTVPASDRTFEHGLGLFETLRTWNGRPTLLAAHRARMLRSAEELSVPIDPADFPDDRAVARLLRAEGSEEDRTLRITATGGSGSTTSVVWMRSSPLPPPMGEDGWKVELGSWLVTSSDPMARHKSLNYWSRRLAFERARAMGFDEALSLIDGVSYGEGSRSNLFVIRGDLLMTPSLESPIVPGVMRGLILELARLDAQMEVREVSRIEALQLHSADAIFLTNAVGGIMPVTRAGGIIPDRWMIWPAGSRWTDRLRTLVADRVASGGDET